MYSKDLLNRYDFLIRAIGIPTLAMLPEAAKEALKNTTDLKTKVKMLELIYAELRKEQTK